MSPGCAMYAGYAYIITCIMPKPVMPSIDRSSKPPVTANSALPTLILSTPSSTDTAAVAHAATGWTIAP